MAPLAVKKFGSGPYRYVALHGWGGSHDTFLPLSSHVPLSASVEAVDLPGYGDSALPSRWEVSLIAEMVADSIQPQGAITVVGNCTGGVIGAELARIRPGLVERLVVIDPFAFVPWYFSIFLKGSFGRMAYRTTFASPVGRFFTNQAMRGKRTENSDLTASFKRVDHEATHSFLKMMGEHEGPSRYAGLTLPVDILLGEKTFGAVKKSAQLLHETWPQARIHVIPGAGHLPIEEQPEALAEAVFNYE